MSDRPEPVFGILNDLLAHDPEPGDLFYVAPDAPPTPPPTMEDILRAAYGPKLRVFIHPDHRAEAEAHLRREFPHHMERGWVELIPSGMVSPKVAFIVDASSGGGTDEHPGRGRGRHRSRALDRRGRAQAPPGPHARPR